MKITKSFKKGFIAFALSLATVFTGAGFGLLGNVVTADEGDAPVTKPITSVGDMFIGENLTVTENGKSYKYDADAETPDTKPDYSGVLLSAQDKDETTGKGSVYKAEINAVFKDVATIEFSPSESASAYCSSGYQGGEPGRTLWAFRVQEAKNPEQFFDVVWLKPKKSNSHQRMNIALRYIDEDGVEHIRAFNTLIYSGNEKKSKYYVLDQIPTTEKAGFAPTPNNAEWTSKCLGGIKLQLDPNKDSNMEVYVKSLYTGYVKLAEFDGTDILNTAIPVHNGASSGLPALDFVTNGYTVTYLSHYPAFGGLSESTNEEFNEGASMLMTSIAETKIYGGGEVTQTLDLSQELPVDTDEIPTFVGTYTDESVTKTVSVDYKKINGELWKTETATRYDCMERVLPAYPEDIEGYAQVGWYIENENENHYYNNGILIPRYGKVYLPKLKVAKTTDTFFEVTDINGNALNAEQYTVQSNIATLWGQHVTAKNYTTAQAKENLTGTKISVDTETVDAYRVNFKGVFAGSTTIKFDFAEALARTSYYNDGRTNNGAFATFRITSAVDTTKYFDVVYFCANHLGGTLATVVYYDAKGNVVHTNFNASNQPVGVTAYPVVDPTKANAVKQDKTNYATGVLNLNNLSGKMVVSVGSVNTMNVASKLSDFVFEGGYTVSYLSEVYKPIKHGNETIPVALDEVGLQGTDGKVVHPAYHNLPIMFTSIVSGSGTLDFSDTATTEFGAKEPIPHFYDVYNGMKEGIKYCMFDSTYAPIIDGKVTIPTNTATTKPGEALLGWSKDGQIYKPGTTVEHSEMSFYKSISIQFAMDTKISLRVGPTLKTTGLKFKLWLDKSSVDLYSTYIGKFGMTIVNDASVDVIETLFDSTRLMSAGDVYGYYSKIVTNGENFDAKYSASAFVEVTYDGGETYERIYANDTASYTYTAATDTTTESHELAFTEGGEVVMSYKRLCVLVENKIAASGSTLEEEFTEEQLRMLNYILNISVTE